ncbi:MAG: metallophosphoesterase family protein [Candidatus Omnitrophica bacterium]|nr:metallophosphoesterase family protein [Candidatus Omnitrophota bacterium]MCA9445737.1 metallophosphoesterase family protein [Candidatus Omnitrophota bacterium]
MRIAILSDIHGNLEALQSVLDHAKGVGYDRLVCLGDVVGYGANPQECVDTIREIVSKDNGKELVVKGNHDDAASGGGDEYFNDQAQRAIRWTAEQLNGETLDWLRDLEMVFCFDPDYFLVHASPYQPENWHYVVNMGDALSAFDSFEEQVAFIGHSHVPFFVSMENGDEHVQILQTEAVEMESGVRYLTNVGSVGQPRDGDPRACYVFLDLEQRKIERHRVDYDIDLASRKIIDAGLPEFLATRLHKGR